MRLLFILIMGIWLESFLLGLLYGDKIIHRFITSKQDAISEEQE